MNMRKCSSIFLVSLMLVLATACGSQRAIVKPPTPATAPSPAQHPPLQTPPPSFDSQSSSAVASDIAATFGNWTTMKAGGTVTLDGGASFSSSMQMRMIKGRSIYISVRPLGLVEVAKLVVTGDTLIVVDKLHKRYLCENVKLITNGIPADVNTLQDIFLGRAFILGEGTLNRVTASKVAATAENGVNTIKPIAQYKGFTYAFKFDSALKILSVEVVPASGAASTYAVNYGDVQYTPAGNVAGSIDVTTKLNNRNFTLKLDYSNFSWNEKVKIDTGFPRNYTKVEGSSLLKMLSP